MPHHSILLGFSGEIYARGAYASCFPKLQRSVRHLARIKHCPQAACIPEALAYWDFYVLFSLAPRRMGWHENILT